MSRVVKCPKCEEQGSLQPKKTKHGTYWRVAHYIGLERETRKIKWCYIGKELPEEITSQLITHDYPKITQEELERNSPKSPSVQENNRESSSNLYCYCLFPNVLKMWGSFNSLITPRWLSPVERQPRKLLAAGSNPARGSNSIHLVYKRRIKS
jgi:hypothetical protein